EGRDRAPRRLAHANLRVRGSGSVVQLMGPFRVGRVAAADEQLPEVVLRASEPRAGPDPLTHLDGTLETFDGHVVAMERGRQAPEIARDGTETELWIGIRDSVGVGLQELVERGGTVALAEPRGRLCEQADADHPILVERDCTEAVCCEVVQLGASLCAR